MEPGREDREHHSRPRQLPSQLHRAAMEPGREDREHPPAHESSVEPDTVLQWNPAVKTGSTLRQILNVKGT